jgi:hypothetical protein
MDIYTSKDNNNKAPTMSLRRWSAKGSHYTSTKIKICLYFKNIAKEIICLYFDNNPKELGYGATRSTDDPCAMGRFSIFKVQMVNQTDQNIFHMKIWLGTKFYIF